jgi:hypothetical protein
MRSLVFCVLVASFAAASSSGAPLSGVAPHHVPPAQNGSPMVARALPAIPPIPPSPAAPAQPNGLFATVALADLGFVNGFRFANLGERMFRRRPAGVGE